MLIACAAYAVGAVGAQGGAQQPSAEAPAAAASLTAEEEAVNRRPLSLPLARPRVVVEKGARRLKLYSGEELVRVRAVALGFGPEGDKEKQGDGRTPEGDYYVCTKNERSRFHLSLGLDYPKAEDAERGLKAGLITRAQYERIVAAARAKRCPPWDTPLGGEIFIHGGGNASDWTWGCVALENAEVEELFNSVPAGTPVRILP